MTPEQIAELKKSHPEAWAAKRAAGLTEQQTAQAIAAQIAHDEAHPPHLARVAEVRRLIESVNAAHAQLAQQTAEAEAAIAELGKHAELLGVTLDVFQADDRLIDAMNEKEKEIEKLLASIAAARAAKSLKAAHEALA